MEGELCCEEGSCVVCVWGLQLYFISPSPVPSLAPTEPAYYYPCLTASVPLCENKETQKRRRSPNINENMAPISPLSPVDCNLLSFSMMDCISASLVYYKVLLESPKHTSVYTGRRAHRSECTAL